MFILFRTQDTWVADDTNACKITEERARSISPTKSSPANTPPHNPYRKSQVSSESSRFQARNEDSMTSPTRRQSTVDDAVDHSSGSPTTKENAPILSRSTKAGDTFETVAMQNQQDSNPPSPRSAAPAKELSWQRRPKSQASERPRSRPLSQFATENASAARSPTSTSNRSSADDKTLSRDQIAQSLASKDPTFFRQTADRGTSSAAYRKTQVEDAEVADHSVGAQLPGMSRREPERNSSADPREISPNKGSPTRSTRSRTMPSSILNMDGIQGTRSPMPMSPAQRLDPPGSDMGDSNDFGSSRERNLAMSPSQGRISPDRAERPLSPTKGMGGFVQSAMLKRSDSVNKRWSVQSPQGLNRTNSTTSNRSSYHPNTSSANLGELLKSPPLREPTPLSREHTPKPSSRPSSSYGGSNTTAIQNDIERAETPKSSMALPAGVNDSFVKPIRPATRSVPNSAATSKEDLSLKIEEAKEPEAPASPSRRWSPTKSSWLETALNKPDAPPKPKTAGPIQPSWMAEIAKAKQKSVDTGASRNAAPKHEVNIGGLMRSPPMGVSTKPLTLGSLSRSFDTPSLRSPEAATRLSPTKTGGESAKQVDGRASPRPSSSSSRAEKPQSSSSNISPTGIDGKTPVLQSPEASMSPSLALGKVKPETPPKKDFRSNLKPRQPPPSSGEKNDVEFKSVFGQLKRTKTQNYVAPDPLKDNILRGKSALNVTGGPKKTDRVDEFRESILKKKKDFEKVQVEGKGVTRTSSSASRDEAVPEAIAKRRTLVLEKEKSIPPSTPPKPTSIQSTERNTPEALVKARAVRGDVPKPSVPIPQKQVSAPGKLPAGGKLADRFNPALAGILARGPPSAASENSGASSPSSQRTASQGTSADTAAGKPGPKLEHMTKSRARGPKRKAPSSLKVSDKDEKEADKTVIGATAATATVRQWPATVETTLEPEKIQEPVNTKQDDLETGAALNTSQPSSPRKRTMTINRRSRFLEELANKNDKVPEPTTPRSPIKKLNIEEIFQTPSSPVKETPKSPIRKLNHEFLPKNSVKAPEIEKQGDVAAEVKNNPISTSNNSTITKKRLIIPPKSPELTKKLGDAAKMSDKSEPVSKPDLNPKPMGLSGQSTSNPVQENKFASPQRPASTRPFANVLAPINVTRPKAPLSPSKDAARVQTPLSSASPSKKGFPSIPQSTEASKLLREFFGEPTSPPPNYEIDTTAILMDKPSTDLPKVNTISCQLFQLAAGGKKTPVPQSLEKTLFEGNLYLCIHSFKTPASYSKITEVYFWIGDEVPESVVHDAEVFASREAKSAGGKLIVLYQGRESPLFFHALGGIVITRRGTSNKYDSLAPYILCGRQCLGSIAFDEVEFSPNSFCSGFPFIVNSQSAKIWLWKGKGSTASEINHARSVGEEVGVMGDIEEVEEGTEPDDFLKVFGDGRIKIRGGAGHWKLKTNYPGYCGRLFKIDVAKVCVFSYFSS